MGLARALSVALVGLRAHVVTVEVDIAMGLPGLGWTGLPDAAVRQSGERVKAAVTNSRETWPSRRITVGLSPAAVPKTGSGFDLAVAICVLAAAGAVPTAELAGCVLLGELGLDGRVHPVNGVLPAVIGAVRQGHDRVVVAAQNAAEARLVPGAQVTAVASLPELCARLRGQWVEPDDFPEPHPPGWAATVGAELVPPDLADVIGQPQARRAVEVAAAGGHHLLLGGPPGVGKSMLAERLTGLLPDLSPEAGLEVSAIHSVLGALPPGRPLLLRPPFAAPHHSASVASLVGGGVGMPQPGAVSLAHHGVLFLDEAAEFAQPALDALRQPLETGRVTISRSRGVTTYPCRFQLVAATNPCGCARGGVASSEAACVCTSVARRSYQRRLFGPLGDRIDLRVELAPVSRAVLVDGASGESTATVRARVDEARARAQRRLTGSGWTHNAAVPGPQLRLRWPVPAGAVRSLLDDVDMGRLSTRGIDRVLAVAWTVADLRGHDAPDASDVDEARQLRYGGLPGRRREPVSA